MFCNLHFQMWRARETFSGAHFRKWVFKTRSRTNSEFSVLEHMLKVGLMSQELTRDTLVHRDIKSLINVTPVTSKSTKKP